MNISMRRFGRHSFPSGVPRTPGILWSLLLGTPLVFSQTLPGTWLFFGGGLDNNHNASFEQNINTRNVGSLGVKWVYQTTPSLMRWSRSWRHCRRCTRSCNGVSERLP